MVEKSSAALYEYARIPRSHSQLHFLLDCYESLGWEQDTRLGEEPDYLTLRRSCRLSNHMELTRLQGHLEACLAQLDALEGKKGAKAISASLGMGILGALLMGLSIASAINRPCGILPCLVLGIPALALWALAPVVHNKLCRRQTAAVSEWILQKQEEILEICEKGSRLL